MIDVENVPSELLVLSGTRLCMGTLSIAPGVADINQIMLRMPGGTGAIATIHSVSVFASLAQRIVLGPTQNTYANPGVEAFTDGRIFGQGTTAQVLGEGLLVQGSTFFEIRNDSVRTDVFTPPRGFSVITPGNAFSVSCVIVNSRLTVSFLWSERVAQPSELNL